MLEKCGGLADAAAGERAVGRLSPPQPLCPPASVMGNPRPEMPIDRLRAGTMLDDEVLAVAADVVRTCRVFEQSQDIFILLAARLEQVKLPREEQE